VGARDTVDMHLAQVCNLLSNIETDCITLGVADVCVTTGRMSNSRPVVLNLSRNRSSTPPSGSARDASGANGTPGQSQLGVAGQVPDPQTPQSINLIPESLWSYQEVNLAGPQSVQATSAACDPHAILDKGHVLGSSSHGILARGGGSFRPNWNEKQVAFM
jgi:hypothetical protein